MSLQKTNLDISPYYDDFDTADNFYKVLFRPGRPVQARDLTTLQSILQNQIDSFGTHIFKEGSLVIPGSVVYDEKYYSVKLDSEHLCLPVSFSAQLYQQQALPNKRIINEQILLYILGEIQYLSVSCHKNT